MITRIFFHKSLTAGFPLTTLKLFVIYFFVNFFCGLDGDRVQSTPTGTLPFNCFECTLLSTLEPLASLTPMA